MAKPAGPTKQKLEIFFEDGPLNGTRNYFDIHVPDHVIMNMGQDRYEYVADRPPDKKIPRRTYRHNPEWKPASHNPH